jgi:hypothetical protein
MERGAKPLKTSRGGGFPLKGDGNGLRNGSSNSSLLIYEIIDRVGECEWILKDLKK